MRWQDPTAGPGQTVGLFGGSFDPPHAGHAHLTREALKRLSLDRVWWLVSPANPLKRDRPAPAAARLQACRQVITHPRVAVTDIEARVGTRATVDTIDALRRRYPYLRFVWLMGADNLTAFHHWDRWQAIMAAVPIAVLARPGQRMPALTSRAARQYARYRLPARDAARLAFHPTPVWTFLDMPMRGDSSTALRLAGAWPSDAGAG
ncbi:nicotinate-nucleotide adenylyltransferase [Pararhodobacter sp. SW119]|uniref:nicotinate-nucleotide adenylyltransferase n=1 Tax=Pararhodobacter sp. SW119 TaxID=2780075 RepID=UPI001ADF0499|nr:nicotinate-nucleotide adenylyltransferase [Pararhodobacter sp. SW119]